MANDEAVTLKINDASCSLQVGLRETLLTTLRDRLQLTAAKRGCNQGVCGACTVEIDGVPMRACLTLSMACAGSVVRTIEGLEADATMRRLQERFVEHGALQCGFCTSGMLIAARALVADNASPDEADIRTALSGNLCRCTGYTKIIAAVAAAAEAAR